LRSGQDEHVAKYGWRNLAEKGDWPKSTSRIWLSSPRPQFDPIISAFNLNQRALFERAESGPRDIDVLQRGRLPDVGMKEILKVALADICLVPAAIRSSRHLGDEDLPNTSAARSLNAREIDDNRSLAQPARMPVRLSPRQGLRQFVTPFGDQCVREHRSGDTL
jgi:hypothetical protein